MLSIIPLQQQQQHHHANNLGGAAPITSSSEPPLLQLCRSRIWASVYERSQSHRMEAAPSESALRGEGSTALSVAVRARAPVEVVQQLVAANCHQVGVTNRIRGSILHEALKHRVEDSVFELLVLAVLRRDDSPRLLSHADELGRTALHYLIDRVIRILDQGYFSVRHWETVRLVMEGYPQNVAALDADGATPLVLLLLMPKLEYPALEHHVYNLVKLMLRVCPSSVAVSRHMPRPWHCHFEEVEHLDGEGVPSPLSCALLHGRSLDTIRLLLETSHSLGIVSTSRSVVTHHSEVPLHVATSMRCSTAILSTLVQQDRSALTCRDCHELSPFDWAWIRHILDCSTSPDSLLEVKLSRRRYLPNHFPTSYQQLSTEYIQRYLPELMTRYQEVHTDLTTRLTAMIPAMAVQSLENESEAMIPDGVDFPLLHAAAHIDCPLALLSLCTKKHPEQLAQREELLGRLPLHFAVGRGGYKKVFPVGVTCSLMKVQEAPPAHMILSAFPKAARVTDNCHRLPLHIAIDHAKSSLQEQVDDLGGRYPTIEAINSSFGVIAELLRVNPKSLRQRDGVTKLYPFLQAAEGCDGNLGLTFELIRFDPSMLLLSLPPL